MRSKAVKILLPTAMFALLLVSFLPGVLAQPMLFGHDLKDIGSWSEDVNLFEELGITNNNNLTFGVSYVNVGRVQNLYLALEKWQWDLGNKTAQGTAPIQLLAQRYHAVGGKDVIALNAFTGLVAYRNNATNLNARPDQYSEIYYGWTLYGELIKNYSNGILEDYFGVQKQFQFDENKVGSATPIWDNSSTNVTFGMSYRNLFVFWQKVNIDVEPNSTAGTPEFIFSQAVAWSVIDSLNFSYSIGSTELSDGKTAVTTTTEYQIGAITDLWVREASATNSSEFGVTPLFNAFDGDIGDVWLGHYNTTALITQRLNGTALSHGFSLGVMNYAVIIVLDQTEQDDTWDDGSTDDGTAPVVNDTSDINVQQLNLRLVKRASKAYNINFAAKPTYVLNGTKEIASPTYVYPKLRINPKITRALWDGTKWLVKRLWGSNFFGNYKARFDTAYVGDLVYITCFPEWAGLSCVQDPTFTAFTSLQGIDAYPLLFLGLAAVPALYFLVRKYRR